MTFHATPPSEGVVGWFALAMSIARLVGVLSSIVLFLVGTWSGLVDEQWARGAFFIAMAIAMDTATLVSR